MNGVRSSRKLEKECVRNTELQWLISGLTPNYHSIAYFRKINPQTLPTTFKLFVPFLKDADLVMGIAMAYNLKKWINWQELNKKLIRNKPEAVENLIKSKLSACDDLIKTFREHKNSHLIFLN